MFATLWHSLFFDPIYNLLIVILDYVPGGDVGLAIVVLTVLIKLVLLPLSLRAARTQHAMRTLEPTLSALKERHKNDREALARETFAVYKEAGVNPFAIIALTLVQIPIVFALYLSVSRGGGVPFPEINTALLYSFVPPPGMVDMIFLGIVNIAGRSLPLALLAGLTQFIHGKLSLPPLAPREKDAKPSLKDDFARSMHLQMRYALPLVIFFVAYTISATIGLYLLVSNLAAIAQEFVVRRKIPGYNGHNQPTS